MTKLTAGVMLALLPLLAVVGPSLKPSIVVIEVHEGDDRRIVAPVPLAVVRAGLALAPEEIREIRMDEHGSGEAVEAERFLPELHRMAEALRDAPDGTYLEARDGEGRVNVGKEEEILTVRVAQGDGERVNLALPLDVLVEGSEAFDTEAGTIRTAALVSALAAAPSGRLLHVVDGDAEVDIRMW